ncbi:putative serine protease EDA2 [Cladorrhinum sp. PSN332]|nr:putative serine protease EDA2 [Cladorrhinum sp. PSN332]
MKTLAISLLLGIYYSAFVQAVFPRPPLVSFTTSQLRPGPNNGKGTFTQLIDHSNASVGTFSQRFWWSTEFWGGPGSPVILFNAGESPADYYTGYLTNDSIVGLYAQAMHGAMVMLEHRYWGGSSPYQVLDTKNLTYLTLNNSIEDMAHFARTVRLPFDRSGDSNAPKAPWIIVGGSYPGALAAWTSKLSPGTFWAYHASSAPVQVVGDFWQYWEPVRQGMPQNCSMDFMLIAEHVDDVLARKDPKEILELKTLFGLEDLVSNADFASYNVFYQMCDTVRGARPVKIIKPLPGSHPNPVDPTKGIATMKALTNYAAWWMNEYFPDSCAGSGYAEWNSTYSTGCYDTTNFTSPYFTNLQVSAQNSIRPWMWMVCNEPFGWWQTAAPKGEKSLLSRAINAEYQKSACYGLFPPEGDAQANTWKVPELTNLFTDGWFLETTRVLWVNGEFDPWRSASISSDFRDDGPFQSTAKQPVFVIKGGRHCSDLDAYSGERVQEIGRVQRQAVSQMVKWVKEFYDVEERRQAGWEWLEPCKGNGTSCGGSLSK